MLHAQPHILGLFFLFQWLRDYEEASVKVVLGFSVDLIVHSPEPDLTALWYRGQYSLMLQIGGYLTVAVALVSTLVAILKGGLKEVLRTYLLGIPVAIFGAVVAVAFVTLLQKVDQDMTVAVLSHTKTYYTDFYNAINNANNGNVNGLNVAAAASLEAMLFMLILVFTVVLWIELVFRQIMIYMAVLFLPLGLAAYIWPPIRGWFVGLAEVIATMVFSKFIIVRVMSFGFLAIANGFDSIATFVGGFLTILLASLASPLLIVFVMQPRHDILQRGQITPLTPAGNDRAGMRGHILSTLRGGRGRGGGGGRVSG